MRYSGRGSALAAAVALATCIVSPAYSDDLRDRGSYLVNTIMACGNCHSPRGPDGSVIPGKELSGGSSFDVPPFAVTASNITPDVETGIGSWSDEELKRALTEGIRPDH